MDRCFRFLCALAALMLAGLAGSAAMASVTIADDGANGGSAKILIRSAIHKGDLAAFEGAIDRVSRTATARINGIPFITVELNSPGGDVVEAIAIGRVIYRHAAMTLVRPGQECVSACVFIMMAGAVHTPIGALVGVHKPMLVSWRNMSYADARAKYDGLMLYLRGYFHELGVSDEAYDIMMRTGSADMHYFTWWEMEQLGLRGEGPEWRARLAERQAAAAEQEARRNWVPDEAPSLPKIDEAWRQVVFMPGDLHGKDYYAGTDIQPAAAFDWASINSQVQRLTWDRPDVVGFAIRLAHAIWDMLKPVWWLLAILLFEILRADPNNWPDHPFRSRRDQWRLRPFESTGLNTASAPAPDRA
jgi:hypothetical protein